MFQKRVYWNHPVKFHYNEDISDYIAEIEFVNKDWRELFEEYIETEQRRKEEYVHYIKENLDRTATDWEINFEPLNEHGMHLLCGYLQKFLQNKILVLPFIVVNTKYHSQ